MSGSENHAKTPILIGPVPSVEREPISTIPTMSVFAKPIPEPIKTPMVEQGTTTTTTEIPSLRKSVVSVLPTLNPLPSSSRKAIAEYSPPPTKTATTSPTTPTIPSLPKASLNVFKDLKTQTASAKTAEIQQVGSLKHSASPTATIPSSPTAKPMEAKPLLHGELGKTAAEVKPIEASSLRSNTPRLAGGMIPEMTQPRLQPLTNFPNGMSPSMPRPVMGYEFKIDDGPPIKTFHLDYSTATKRTYFHG